MDGLINFFTNVGLPIAYVLLGIALLVSIIFPLLSLITNFGEKKKALLGFAALAVLILIGLALAGNTLPDFASKAGLSLMQFKLISAGIFTAILATVGLLGFIIFDGIMGLFRN